MSFASARLALTLTALVVPSALAQADAPLAQSTFAAGAEGWLSLKLPYPSAVPPTILGSFAPTWVAALGGYIKIDDPDGSNQVGMAQYWSAPAAFLGDKSAAYGGSLQFDLANSLGSSFFVQEDLLLVGAGLTLVHALGGVPVPAFTHFTIPLDETGWTVGGMTGPAATATQMRAALAALDSLYVRAEYKNGQDTQFLDSVTLGKGPWTVLGSGLAGVAGVPSLLGNGTLQPGSAGALALTKGRPSAPVVLFVSFASTPVPFKGGTLVPVPVALTVFLATNGSGDLLLPWTWPTGVPAGTSIWFQDAIQDAAAIKGVALSNELRAITP